MIPVMLKGPNYFSGPGLWRQPLEEKICELIVYKKLQNKAVIMMLWRKLAPNLKLETNGSKKTS